MMDADGTNSRPVARPQGLEFDGAGGPTATGSSTGIRVEGSTRTTRSHRSARWLGRQGISVATFGQRLGAGLVAGRTHNRLQLDRRRRRIKRLSRCRPTGQTSAGSTRTSGLSTRRSHRHEDRLHGPRGRRLRRLCGRSRDRRCKAAQSSARLGRVACVVAGWLDHRLCFGTRRLPARSDGRAVLGGPGASLESITTSGSWTRTDRTHAV